MDSCYSVESPEIQIQRIDFGTFLQKRFLFFEGFLTIVSAISRSVPVRLVVVIVIVVLVVVVVIGALAVSLWLNAKQYQLSAEQLLGEHEILITFLLHKYLERDHKVAIEKLSYLSQT